LVFTRHWIVGFRDTGSGLGIGLVKDLLDLLYKGTMFAELGEKYAMYFGEMVANLVLKPVTLFR
jgi:hypothetical protein